MDISFKYLRLLGWLVFASSQFVQAAPPVINYSGQVAVDGSPFTGTAYLKFAFVNESGDVTYWSHDGTSANGSAPDGNVSVSVTGGLYSILIGDTQIAGMGEVDASVFQNHDDVRLRVWLSDGVNGFEQIMPDRRFASVPYVLGISDGSISSAKLDPNLTRYFSPSIEVAPVATSVIQGANTTLSVGADGRFLTYQWKRNGETLVGETNPTLSLAEINASTDDANYSVVISNDWGSVTSENVRLTVATALPSITRNGSASITHEAATSYVDAGATAADALGNDLTSSIVVSGADVNVTELGEHTVSYSVTDVGGNTNSDSRTVMVEDTTAPVLSLIGDNNHSHGVNTAWADPGYSATDSLEGNLTANVAISGDIDVNTTGEYTLTYSVSDSSGNEANLTRTVNVQPLGPWTFTNAGATGRSGPTQAQIDANYSGTSLEGLVTINTQGIQEWTVPAGGNYKIEAWGAGGGDKWDFADKGGKGMKIAINYGFSKGQVVNMVIGQKGGRSENLNSSGGGGGGGASIVYEKNTNLLILIAGGGGGIGAGNTLRAEGRSASISRSSSINQQDRMENGSSSYTYFAPDGYGGTSYGVQVSGLYDGGGGAGWLSNGDNGVQYPQTEGGKSRIANWLGGNVDPNRGSAVAEGGFGGGAAASDGGGGGAGFTGGNGGKWNSLSGGGGGTCYAINNTSPTNLGLNESHGKVVITWVGN